MATEKKLFLHEEIMLLALRAKEGTLATGTMYQYAIGGAVLAELLLNKRIGVEAVKKNRLVNLVDSRPLGDPVIDECLERIKRAKRRASLQTLVSRFAGLKNLKHRVAEQLCRRGILQGREDKIFLIFTRRIYPEVDPQPETKLIGRLERAIFTDIEDVDPRTVVLVSLANSTGLLKVIFDKTKLKGRKARIEKIINGEVTGKAAKEAIEAVQAAAMMSVIMTSVMTTVVTTSATR